MTTAERSASSLGIRRVVSFTFQFIRANLGAFSALSIIVTIPTVILRYEEALLPGEDIFTSPVIALSVVFYAVCGTALTAAISKAIIPDRSGHIPALASCISAVASDLVVLSAIAVVSFALFLLGYILLVLPGFYLGAIFAVVVPVRIVEGTGFIRTFVRGAQLTRGHRWPVFGLLLASFALTVASEAVVNILSGDPPFAGYTGEVRSAGIGSLIGSAVAELATSLIGATGTAVVYAELRHIKDGPGPDALAAEFD